MATTAGHSTNHATPKDRAVGIVRVSQVGGREGERFVSPAEQRERIEATCTREGFRLIDVHEEMDVKGDTPIEERPGLRAAIETVEARKAEVVVGAYFDRLFRSLSTQAEVIDRIESAGGKVLAVDVGQVTNASAGQWLSGTMLGAVSEYFKRSVKERSAEGQARAVARGATPWARVPLGYDRSKGGDSKGELSVNPDEVPIVRRAFEMRAAGESVTQIRNMLKSHGIERSHRGVQVMLANRIYLGEIHFGKLVNPVACEPIIEQELFDRVQRMVIPRGPKPKSTRLLARLGVLRCGSCGARLSSMKLPKQNDYPIYRCPSTSDCDHHVTISAEIAEQVIVDRVRAALADVTGRASAAANVQDAELALEQTQQALDGAIRAFDGFDEPSARERLLELRKARDSAQTKLDQLGGAPAAVTLNAADDWDLLNLDEKRGLIRSTVERATVVHGGRGAERITLKLFGE
ncbi:MAG: recombinase family protein [Solirubrobacterales bacterium]